MPLTRIQAIDSHTGGEPTRVVISGGPDLGTGPLSARRHLFARHHDAFRASVVNEPRGSDVIVGALLLPPADPARCAGVIFFNNVGTLGMCGHGTIGLAVTLGHLGKIAAGTHGLETPVGTITFEYDGANTVSLENVPAHRHAKSVGVPVEGLGEVTGDIAWGGNWFFLVSDHQERLALSNVSRLTDVAQRIRRALAANDITGANGEEIDHVELFSAPADPKNHSRNFVLCPGGAYDRSPCGTGTSAKLACLAAEGKLAPGQLWRQESILGSVFEGSYRMDDDKLIPRITGKAHITAEATLLIDPEDPFGHGVPP